MGKQAEPFSTSKTYAVGDVCLYGELLYRFTSTHTGTWNSSHAVPVDNRRERQITRVVAGYDNTLEAVAYAQTIVFEPQLITGTDNRYRYILTNAEDPRK